MVTEKPEQLAEYELVRDVTASHRLTSFIVKGKDKEYFIANWLNRDKLLTSHEFAIHQYDEDLPLEVVKKRALAKVDREVEERRNYYQRVKGLSHPNVAEVYAFFHDPQRDVDVLISEYVEGQSMFDATSGLSPMQMMPIFTRNLEGLDFGHSQNLLNLKIRSGSFRVNLTKAEMIVKLMDHGLGVPKGEYDGTPSGTGAYTAPEVASKQLDKINEKADLYSWAVLAYRCLTRHYPFEERLSAVDDNARLVKIIQKEGPPQPLKSWNPQVPDKLQDLVLNLLEPNPDDRKWNSAGDFAQCLYNEWPEASRNMVVEATLTSSGPVKY